jgi:hypothetical protein
LQLPSAKIYVSSISIPRIFTIEFWVKFSNTDTTYHSLFYYKNEYNNYNYIACTHYIGLSFAIKNYNNKSVASGYSGESVFSDKKWHHVAVQYDGAEAQVYIDDVLNFKNISSEGTGYDNSSFYIGWSGSTPECYIKGFRISSVARYPEPIPEPILMLCLYNNSIYGLNSGTYEPIIQNWNSLSDTEKINTFDVHGLDIYDSSVNLASIPGDFRVLAYSTSDMQLSATLTKLPKPQTVLPTSLISLKSYEYVDSVSITYTVSGNGIIKVAMTKDLSSYYVYSSGEFVEIDIDDIATDGNTPAEINSIPESDLHDFTSGVDGIAFAYYISISNTTDVAKLSEISIQADGKGVWKSAQPYTDFTYEYANNDLLRVNLITAGDYKINYPD